MQEGDEIVDLGILQGDRSNIDPRHEPLHFPTVVERQKVCRGKPVRGRENRVPRSPGVKGTDGIQVVDHDIPQFAVRAVVAVGSGEGNIAKHGRAEPVGVLDPVAFTHATDVPGVRIEEPGPPGSDMGQCQGVELLIREQSAVVTISASSLAEEELHPPCFFRTERVGVACEIAVVGAVETAKLLVDEVREGIGNVLDLDVLSCCQLRVGHSKQVHVFRNDPDPLGNCVPSFLETPAGRLCDVVLFPLSGHLELGCHGKEGLCRDNVC